MKNIFLIKSYFKFGLVLLTIVLFVLLISPVKNIWAIDTGLEDTAKAAELPTTNLITIVGQIISILLGFLGAVFIILILWGGFMRMTARGNSEQVATSMKIIASAVIGLIIILASYALTAFVMGHIKSSVGEGGEYTEFEKIQNATCNDLGGSCYPIMNCPSNTRSEGQRDCGTNQACCAPI